MDQVPALTIALGGAPLLVRKLDGSSEEVAVRIFKITEYPEYLKRLEDEERLAEFACGKPDGWAATLEVDSLLDLTELAHDLNFSRARRWGERRARINEALLPIAVQGQKFQSALGNSAPTPR